MVVGAVRRRGGVAQVSALVDEGHSRYRVAQAVKSGMLIRVRRDWVALPDADPELIAAARHAVVLSCVTEARRRGLWVLAEPRPHVGADAHGARGKPDAVVVHWNTPPVPRRPGVLVDPIENVLAAVAGCQPFETALAIWDSALRQELITLEALRSLTLRPGAQQVLAHATPFSDSGLETLFRTRLRWLRLRILFQIWICGHRVDFLIGERLVVQLDGGHHVDAQRSADVAHDALLASLGYHVLRFTYAQVVSDWPAVQDAIMRAIGAGLHLAA